MAHERTALSSSNNTAFEKIIRRHIVDQSDGELQEGDCKWILVDHVTVPWNMATLLTDLLPTVEKEFISALQQWRIDNYSQEERWNHQLSRRGTVREQTSWQVSGLPLAGSVLIGLEPSCIKWGALGCVSFPAVQCDFPDILSKSQVWLNIPPVIKIGISERVASVIGSNNIIQSVHTILERVGVTGPIAIEFTGKGCFYLSIEERMKIIDSVNNCNVICCLFPPDEKTKRHLYSKLENLQQVLVSVQSKVPVYFYDLLRQQMDSLEQVFHMERNEGNYSAYVIWIDEIIQDEYKKHIGWERDLFCIYQTCPIDLSSQSINRNETLPPILGGFVLFCPTNSIDATLILPKSESTFNSRIMNAFDPSFEQKLIPCTQPIVLVVGFDFGKNGWHLSGLAKCLWDLGIHIIIGGTFDYAFYRNAVNQGILVLQSPEFVKFLQHCEWNVEERSLSFQADSGVYSETTCLYLSEALPTKCQVKLQLDQWKLWFPVHHGNVEVRSFPIEPSSKIIQEKCIFSTTLT